jgi:AraC-like DNA-binding protein
VCKSQGGSGALGNGAVVNDTLLFDRVSGPVKALDVARIAGCSETTIHRAFGLDTGISDLFREKIFSISKEIGYVRLDPYGKISKEFLTGKKTIYGTPEYNAELIISLKKSGLSINKISHASGISRRTLRRILLDNNVSTINPQTKFINGLSKARTLALKTLENKKTRFQLKVRSSETRNTIARIIKEYKKGRHIETLCHEYGLSKSIVWSYLGKSFAYKILKAKRIMPFKGAKDKIEINLKSKKYRYEKEMSANVLAYLHKTYPFSKVEPEHLTYKTHSSAGKKGFVCDFFIPDTNEVFEVKQRTTTSSNKALFGQIFVSQSCGYKVNVIFPDDVIISDSTRNILTKNNVDIHTIS